MTFELPPLEKINKAKKCFVWVSSLSTHVRTTKEEARALYRMHKNNRNPNYRWYLEYVKALDEYWLYIN
jgi:hypothetical protein